MASQMVVVSKCRIEIRGRRTWALIRVLRSALTWSLSPQLVRATNDRPAVYR